MPRAIGAHVRGAGLRIRGWRDDRMPRRRAQNRLAASRINFGGDRFPNRFQPLPRRRIAAGHKRRAVASAFLAAGDARAEEREFAAIFFLACDGVGPQRIAAIDYDVIGLDSRGDQLLAHRIHRRPGLHEDDDDARSLDRAHEILH